jgi:hypothetical protein
LGGSDRRRDRRNPPRTWGLGSDAANFGDDLGPTVPDLEVVDRTDDEPGGP